MNDPCANSNQLAITDDSGTFKIEKERKLKFFYAPFVAPVSIASLSLCISFEGTTVFADQVMWPPYDAIDISLECDLASPRTFSDINGQKRIRLCQAPNNLSRNQRSVSSKL